MRAQEGLREAGVEAEIAVHAGDDFREDFLGAMVAGLKGVLVDRWGRYEEGSYFQGRGCVIRRLTQLADLLMASAMLIYCSPAQLNLMKFKVGGLTVELVEGDITELEADAIVNAANPYLKHGGGVAAAIVRKGGWEIQEESDRYVREHGPVPVGGVAVTGAGKLKARYVIHAVGPRYGEEGADEELASAIRSALAKAEELDLRSIALPAISTGAYGYPLDKCARIMARTIKAFAASARSLKRVIVCLYGRRAYEIFEEVFREKLCR